MARAPSFRLQKASGQGLTTTRDKDYYFGPERLRVSQLADCRDYYTPGVASNGRPYRDTNCLFKPFYEIILTTKTPDYKCPKVASSWQTNGGKRIVKYRTEQLIRLPPFACRHASLQIRRRCEASGHAQLAFRAIRWI